MQQLMLYFCSIYRDVHTCFNLSLSKYLSAWILESKIFWAATKCSESRHTLSVIVLKANKYTIKDLITINCFFSCFIGITLYNVNEHISFSKWHYYIVVRDKKLASSNRAILKTTWSYVYQTWARNFTSFAVEMLLAPMLLFIPPIALTIQTISFNLPFSMFYR